MLRSISAYLSVLLASLAIYLSNQLIQASVTLDVMDENQKRVTLQIPTDIMLVVGKYLELPEAVSSLRRVSHAFKKFIDEPYARYCLSDNLILEKARSGQVAWLDAAIAEHLVKNWKKSYKLTEIEDGSGELIVIRQGDGTQFKNLAHDVKSLHMIERAARLGHPEAQLIFGWNNLETYELNYENHLKKFIDAFECILASARAGHVLAQRYVVLLMGPIKHTFFQVAQEKVCCRGVLKDRWKHSDKHQCPTLSETLLGKIHKDEYIRWLNSMSERGNSEAAYTLACIYMRNNSEIGTHSQEITKLLNHVAQEGKSAGLRDRAIKDLFKIYLDGDLGISPDPTRALATLGIDLSKPNYELVSDVQSMEVIELLASNSADAASALQNVQRYIRALKRFSDSTNRTLDAGEQHSFKDVADKLGMSPAQLFQFIK